MNYQIFQGYDDDDDNDNDFEVKSHSTYWLEIFYSQNKLELLIFCPVSKVMVL